MSRRIFSGIQPTGNLHLGNYLGALRNWVKLQHDYECLFCVVDLHAITVPQDPEKLKNATRETAASFIAAGIDPKHSILFPQSAVSDHSELCWLLGTMVPLGWLNRMTQFKDKAAKSRDLELWGLYSYPVLMAADILLYKATHVPVGEDQKQHLELARDIAGAVNRRFGREIFPLPEPQILGEATRIMSLRDGTKKMSKSDESDYSRINMTDDADTIALKFRKAKTDSEPMPEKIVDLEKRPEADNLVTIFASLSNSTRAQVLARFAGTQFSTFKKELTDLAVSELAPNSERMRELMQDKAELDRLLTLGTDRAQALATPTLHEIQDILGYWRR